MSLIPPPLPGVPSADSIRQAHLNHEASVRAVGTLNYLGAIVFSGVGIGMALGKLGEASADKITPLLVCIGFAALHFWIGRGFRGLRPVVRIPATVLYSIGLLGIPLGTLISAYILYLIHSQKGKTVFSPEYRQIMEATPHIRYKTSIVIWILLGLVVFLVVLVALAAAFAK